MAQQEISTFSKRFTILIGLGVVGAMAFGLSISFYRNLLFEDTLGTLSQRNRDLRAQIDRGLGDLAYYRSLQYRDKYAKENLNRLNPGEKVLILTEESSLILSNDNQYDRTKQREAAYKEYLRSIPTVDHWKLYLFDMDGLERLKRTF